ncbi:hypothetical protein GCM10009834_01480 [Streptomonospora arabica]
MVGAWEMTPFCAGGERRVRGRGRFGVIQLQCVTVWGRFVRCAAGTPESPRARVRGAARPAAEGAGGVAGPGSAGAAAGGGYRPFAARCCCQRSIRAGNSPIMNS